MSGGFEIFIEFDIDIFWGVSECLDFFLILLISGSKSGCISFLDRGYLILTFEWSAKE